MSMELKDAESQDVDILVKMELRYVLFCYGYINSGFLEGMIWFMRHGQGHPLEILAEDSSHHFRISKLELY